MRRVGESNRIAGRMAVYKTASGTGLAPSELTKNIWQCMCFILLVMGLDADGSQ